MRTRAHELHDEFDRGFAAALPGPTAAQRDFLCIRVGGEAWAVPLLDVDSMHAELRVVAIPSRAAELVGVAAIRSAIVPIYDLRIAFGGAASAARHWTLLIRGGAAGFCFEGFDGHCRVTAESIAAATQRGHAQGQLTVDGQPRSIVDLGSILTAIETRWRPPGHAKDA